jgi:hypothetical protein
MRTVLVSLPSGAGVVRLDNGSVLVTDDVNQGRGTYLREADPFHPQKAGDDSWTVVGGLLPPSAVSAEVVDDRADRVVATVAEGAYAALLNQPLEPYETIVCCRDADGTPVRRPWAQEYPSVRVTGTQEPCPACGAVDCDEYTPFEEWRGGHGGPDGTTIPNPVVSCRVCGHEEPEGDFISAPSRPAEPIDEATRAARIARARAQSRKRKWHWGASAFREARFPVYGVEGWPGRVVGSGSDDDGELTEISIYYYETPDADPTEGDLPRLAVVTKRGELNGGGEALREARQTLQGWIGRTTGRARMPQASHAAITLWINARRRERRAEALGSGRSEQLITIDGEPTKTLMLSATRNDWAGVACWSGLTIIVAGREVASASLRLAPITDLEQLAGARTSRRIGP